MSEQSDVVLAYWTEHRNQLRQCETQRSTLTNFLLVIVAGLTGLIVQQKLAPTTLPVAAVIAVLGLYGALSTAKYHERATYHLMQARALTATLTELGVLPTNGHIATNREDHYKRYPMLCKIRLHWLWTGLHMAIAIYGFALVVILWAR